MLVSSEALELRHVKCLSNNHKHDKWTKIEVISREFVTETVGREKVHVSR